MEIPVDCRSMNQRRQWWMLIGVFALAAVMFIAGINWGLPGGDVDRFLFGSHPRWSGQQIINLGGGWDESSNLGADVAQHPLDGRDQPIVLNATDAQRAQIIRRYRLYSDQPDEMITFRSLSRMKPSHGDLDPRLFQYGGLWIYPIGVLLKLASLVGIVTLKSDLAYYLDHPEQFGQFYVLARLYAAVWGLFGVGVIYGIGKEWTGKWLVALTAAVLFAVMPVVVSAAHEAKPHLPGTVLTLCAVLCAMRYAKSGQSRWWILTGVTCGAAAGMVLTGVVSFAVLPVMVLLRENSWKRRIGIVAAAAVIGIVFFVLTNPYLPLDYFSHREILQSNLGNSGNMYSPTISFAGFKNAVWLIGEGMSMPLAVAGGLSAIFLIRRRGLGWLLATPTIVVAIQFLLLAQNKPAEYARFALLLDVMLALAAAAAVGSLRSVGLRTVILLPILYCTGAASLRYMANYFAAGSRPNGAATLAQLERPGRVLAVWSEPAPYCLPAVDLFVWKIVLLPPGGEVQAEGVSVRPDDSFDFTPISWSNKPFDIVQH
jgi:Dolichyl-phosphate-mannose-protein mannosyltransferase